ncbi:MAG: MCP four helix bundle domain-containing protein [Desulfuromonas sp.]|nr:MCP four helix bundle domain-containing protein [Desulfuromonas sp.]
MRIKTKLLSGISALILLMAVVGAVGWYGLNKLAGEMHSVLHQLEIAKQANQTLIDVSETQGDAQRTFLYEDEQYVNKVQEGIERVVAAADNTKALVTLQSNKALADKVKTAATEYGEGVSDWWYLQEEKVESGQERAAAAGMAHEEIQTMLDFELAYVRKTAKRDMIDMAELDNLVEAQEVLNAFNRVQLYGQRYLLTRTAAQQQQAATQWLAELDACEYQIADMIDLFEAPNVIASLEKVKGHLAAYRDTIEVYQTANETQHEQLSVLKAAAGSVMQDSRNVRSVVYKMIEEVSQQAQESESKMINLILIIGLLAAVFGVVVGLFLTGNITKGLNFVVSTLNAIAGKGDVSVSIDQTYLNRSDEIGELSKVAELVLNDYRTITQMAKTLASGDWTTSIKSKSAQDEMNQNLAMMIEEVNKTLVVVAASGDQIASGAGQISDSSQSLSQGATESAASLEEITSSMNEMGSQTTQNAENAGQANRLADEAQSAAQKGNDQMQEMVAAMAEINEAGQNISKIIKVIDEIAFQTNLLALNAAVEAARAGQHGKGFAVVAEEVRNLAARSAKAASETAELIEGSVAKTERGSSIADQTSKALHEIVNGIGKVNDLVAEIATASNEQAQGISQVNQGLGQIDQVTQQNTANAEESAAAAEELNSQAVQLQEMLQRFTLSGVAQQAQQPAMATIAPVAATGWNEMPTSQPQLGTSEQIHLDDDEFGKF